TARTRRARRSRRRAPWRPPWPSDAVRGAPARCAGRPRTRSARAKAGAGRLGGGVRVAWRRALSLQHGFALVDPLRRAEALCVTRLVPGRSLAHFPHALRPAPLLALAS